MNAVYIYGTVEYLVFEIEITTPGFVYDPDEWAAEVALIPSGEAFDEDTADWAIADLETIDDVNYAKVLLGVGDLVPDIGSYQAMLRLSSLGSDEIPLLKAQGTVIVEEG